MSDPFIDALRERLNNAAGPGASGRQDNPERAAALTGWWEEFVDVLGQKVGAWNERQAPRPPINFTKSASGAVHVWHRSAEATFVRDGCAIQVSTRLGAEPAGETIVTLQVLSAGNVLAVTDGDQLRSPTAAAEHLLTPLLVKTFANP
jgi:hypothetical protein